MTSFMRKEQLPKVPRFLSKLLWLDYGKYPVDVEPKMDTTIAPIISRLPQVSTFAHARCIGEMQLEDVPARFNVKAN